jgi:hypothetical protein
MLWMAQEFGAVSLIASPGVIYWVPGSRPSAYDPAP